MSLLPNQLLTDIPQDIPRERQDIILQNIGALGRFAAKFAPSTRVTAYYATNVTIPLEQINAYAVKNLLAFTNRQAQPDTSLTVQKFLQGHDFLWLNVYFNIVARFADHCTNPNDPNYTRFTEDAPVEFSLLKSTNAFVGDHSDAFCIHHSQGAWDAFSGTLSISRDSLKSIGFDLSFGFKTIGKSLSAEEGKYGIIFPVLWVAADIIGLSVT